ncbi:hypothetical protein FHS61_002530 [Altererythrobacter atlanticus]|uniref:histidine kinase n=1 Tax=Croceibacterium atlanticum TaxID=1267766 RepID=A0A0F7KN29_9SPHN|nr:histidine kinase dimerization/phospho-acceptor domain-containing protein [Croceibacterium atlanticum]AKH41938.1 Histidine protein kinase DivJ [Croceibacterium atlanticum]MBB5733495.1 hypothetical protein [Croceibacterium atlanticum]
MLFDDRLATVLRSPLRGETGARTQFRQLIDLLGSMPADLDSELAGAAYDRLAELAVELAAADQSAILREPGLRLRNPRLIGWIAGREPQAAAAAMATARLTEDEWIDLIPRLPVTARGFLRHRRNLPPRAEQLLERLGVGDLVLPQPDISVAAEEIAAAPEPVPTAEASPKAPKGKQEEAEIGALLRRIEQFQARRQTRVTGLSPQLPLDDEHQSHRRHESFDFSFDAQGVVDWADPAIAPLVVGMTIAGPADDGLCRMDRASRRSINRRLPVRSGNVRIEGLAEIAGEWQIQASPAFARGTGSYIGYRGRLCRVEPQAAAPAAPLDDSADRIRQLLHELRTPVNAIQGFAEIIQQQMFGHAPNEYRALAAGIAVDAARLLAGFDEIDRLARLESGAMEMAEGESDLRLAVTQTLRRLEGVLRPRNARLELTVTGEDFACRFDEPELQQFTWRLLATLSGALAPGEIVALRLTGEDGEIALQAELPAALADRADLFAASPSPAAGSVSAGMFGAGFTLRLARAEAQAAGGSLERRGDALVLMLPTLTGEAPGHSVDPQGKDGKAAG